MSFDDRLVQTLVVKRHVTDGTLDDYGQPVTGEMTVATVPGLIQPRSAREMALVSQAGPEVGDNIGFMRPLADLDTGCWIEMGGDRFDVLGAADAAGIGHHLEVSLRRIR